jgi:hypothetical protein
MTISRSFSDFIAAFPPHALILLRDAIQAELDRRGVCEHGMRDRRRCAVCEREFRRREFERVDMERLING